MALRPGTRLGSYEMVEGTQLFYVAISNFGLISADVDTTKGFQVLPTRLLFTYALDELLL